MYVKLRRELLIQLERYENEIYYLLAMYDNTYNFLILITYGNNFPYLHASLIINYNFSSH